MKEKSFEVACVARQSLQLADAMMKDRFQHFSVYGGCGGRVRGFDGGWCWEGSADFGWHGDKVVWAAVCDPLAAEG